MKRSLLVVLILVGYMQAGYAQQYPETSLYGVNPYLINPGFTGYLTDLSGYFSALSPLSLDEDIIRNYRVGFNKSIEKSYIGVGGKLTYDQRDFFESIYMDFSMSYKLVFEKKHVIGLGVDIGLVNRTYSLDNLSQYVNRSDPTLASDYYFGTNMKLGFGVVYYSSFIEAGVAMPYMIEGTEKFTSHFNAYLAYKYFLPNTSWVLKPNIYVANYPDGTQLISGSLMVINQSKLWGQIGGTNANDISFAMGINFSNFQLCYSYLYQLDDGLPYKSPGEVMLLVHFGNSNRILSHISTVQNRKK